MLADPACQVSTGITPYSCLRENKSHLWVTPGIALPRRQALERLANRGPWRIMTGGRYDVYVPETLVKDCVILCLNKYIYTLVEELSLNL